MFFGFPLDRRETAARSFCLPPLEYNPPLRGDRDVPSYSTMRAPLPHVPRPLVVVEVNLGAAAHSTVLFNNNVAGESRDLVTNSRCTGRQAVCLPWCRPGYQIRNPKSSLFQD